jgi:hypothetical protein
LSARGGKTFGRGDEFGEHEVLRFAQDDSSIDDSFIKDDNS